MKIVELDRNTLGYDIDTSILCNLGDFVEYPASSREDNKKHIKDADVIIFNKEKMDEDMLINAPNVKLLCITATGYDNIDLDYARKRNIAVCNVKAYSTAAVAQHTFAMALYLLEKIAYYDDYVKSGKYSKQKGFCNFDEKYNELMGKTWGIIGMGNIGKMVANIAKAFGANVIHYSATGNGNDSGYEEVDFDDLLKRSDILSLHCPLSDKTRGIMDMTAFKKMKKSAILINVARGAVIVDEDLADALEEGEIAAAGLDVFAVEPLPADNPLNRIKDSKKILITPHMAWASVEARGRCLDEVYKNIEAFIAGERRNRVD